MLQYWSGFVSNKGCQLHIIIFQGIPGAEFIFSAGKRWSLALYHRQLLRYERGAVVSDGKKIGIRRKWSIGQDSTSH
jgi:hypothetical protein